MEPPSVEGVTLGQRHRSLNRLTADTILKQTAFEDIPDSPAHSDIARLHKIDVAAHHRRLDYILLVLQSDDALYVSRALRRSVWLVTDPLYADVIDPDYLEKELFPAMTSRAIASTLLFVRLHLRDVVRAERFYNYFASRDRKVEALKWLPSCSVRFIEDKVAVESEHISQEIFKRLCERSFKAFEAFVKKNENNYRLRQYIPLAVFLLNTHTEEFLEIYEKLKDYNRPKLSKKSTSVILNKCPNRVFEKLDIYIRNIDLTTFAKHLGPENIKDMVLKLAKIKKLQGWFSYTNLKSLLQKMPKEGKFEFIKTVFVDKTALDSNEDEIMEDCLEICHVNRISMKCCALSVPGKSVNLSSMYQWYRMAPFGTAFNELKKFIRTEPSPDERISMLKILITCAGKNSDHLHALIQFFREKHINEPAKFKASFVSSLVETTDTHTYDERTWRLLDEIYHSLEVYSNNEDSYEVWPATYSIIAYNVLHDKPIPKVIHSKFLEHFTSFEKIAAKLTEPNKSKLFNYLFNELKNKIDSKPIANKEDFVFIKSTLDNILDLLKHWKKELADFPFVIKLVKDLITHKSALKLEELSLSNIYNTEKKWRRIFFEDSLQLVQNEAVLMNALKHKPDLILQHQDILDKIIKSNSFDLIRILSKLRIYFSDDIAVKWLQMYEQKLETHCKDSAGAGAGFKAVTRGLCVLVERERFTRLLQAYVPFSYKVQWSEEDAALINLRKFFAQQMYLVRPTLDIDTVLLFAKGDYLQYALPSLTSVCSRKSKEECRRFLPILLGGAVSLQKHGIRVAFDKLEPEELVETFTQIWNVTKNASIRAVIFNLTFTLLCREKNSVRIRDLWKLLELFMRNITPEENRTVYATLAKTHLVPEPVRGEFCMQSYDILKALPAKLNCDGLANGMLRDIAAVMDTIDENFVTQILLKHVNETYTQKKILKEGASEYGYDMDIDNLIAKYLTSSPSEEAQAKRYDYVFKAIIEHSLAMWNEVCQEQLKVRKRLQNLVEILEQNTKRVVEKRELKHAIPIGIFRCIRRDTSVLLAEENYKFITRLSLMIAFCESYLEVRSELTNENESATGAESTAKDEGEEATCAHSRRVQRAVAPAFAARCCRILHEDAERYFPSIWSLFGDALEALVEGTYGWRGEFAAGVLQALAGDAEDAAACLTAVALLPRRGYIDANIEPLFAGVRQQLEGNKNVEVKFYYHARQNEHSF